MLRYGGGAGEGGREGGGWGVKQAPLPRFHFVFCEAGFDGRYLHNYICTWVKDGVGTDKSGTRAGRSRSSSVVGGSSSSGLGESNSEPSDPITLVGRVCGPVGYV